MNADLSWTIEVPVAVSFNVESSASEDEAETESLSSGDEERSELLQLCESDEEQEAALRIHRSGQNSSGFG